MTIRASTLSFRRLDAFLGVLASAEALPGEGLGNDGHGQGARFLGDLSDDRSRAGAGAATHPAVMKTMSVSRRASKS